MNEEIISLGFDPGAITGYACIGKRGDNIEIIGTGKIELKEKVLYRRLLHLEKAVEDIIFLMKPWIITCEQVNSARNLGTIRNLAYYQAVITLEAGRKDLPVNFIVASEARKAIELKGNANKEDVAEHLKKMFKSDPDVDWKDYNVTDALAIAVAVVK